MATENIDVNHVFYRKIHTSLSLYIWGTDTSEYVTEFGLVKTAYTWMEKRDIAFKVLCR